MEHRIERASAVGLAAAFAFSAVLVVSSSARAASPSPPATNTLRLTGSVNGTLTKGGRVTFRLGAREPGGFQKLSQLSVTMTLHNLVLAEVSYLQDFNAIAIRGGQLITIGTSEVLNGSFFRINALDVRTETAGTQLNLTIPGTVLQDIPAGTLFQLEATDEDGAVVDIVRAANVQPKKTGGGFSWGQLAAAVAGALFAGSFIGGLFASRRKPQVRPSIYAAVQRRLEEERAPK